MATKPVKIKDLNPAQAQKPYGVYSRYEEYLNLLMNGVRITKSNEEPLNYDVETFIKRTLFEAGAVGYDKATDKWFYVYGEGNNELGNPTLLTLVTANGHAFRKEASYDDKVDGAYKISALPVNMDMGGLIKETTDCSAAASMFLGMVQGLAMQAMAADDFDNMPAVSLRMFDLFLDALGAAT